MTVLNISDNLQRYIVSAQEINHLYEYLLKKRKLKL